MNSIDTSQEIDHARRHFFGAAAVTIAAAQLGISRSATAQSSEAKPAEVPAIKTGDRHVVRPAQANQCRPSECRIRRRRAGRGPCCHSAARLAVRHTQLCRCCSIAGRKGYRVIVPYLRGYGTTTFLSSATMRNGQQSAVALDIIALMDALKIQKAIIAGFDWGARTADIMAVLWPERCKAIVSVGGYLIGSPAANQVPYPPARRSRFGISTISPLKSGRPATRNTCTILRSSSGRPLRRSGTSTTPRSNAQRRRSTIRTTSPSRSTITAGESAWLTASGNTTIWKSGWPRFRPSPCLPSPWKATPTAQSTRPARRIAISSRASMSTASSPAASGTICRRKLRRPLPKRSSMSTVFDLVTG